MARKTARQKAASRSNIQKAQITRQIRQSMPRAPKAPKPPRPPRPH